MPWQWINGEFTALQPGTFFSSSSEEAQTKLAGAVEIFLIGRVAALLRERCQTDHR
jgi:hypothetical protein